ncbi:MAG: radical SAM protein [Planctomycetota bacterium]|nr:radical SAM protein [Planctomycetota bacterium]
MKEVLLVAPLSEEFSGKRNYGDPSLGVHRLAAFIGSHGHKVTLYDCNIHDGQYFNDILLGHFDIIGISILNDTLKLSLELLITLRRHFPFALLVAGGAESILNYQEIFDNTDTNAVILGEGELPLLHLCNDRPVGDIKGIIWRKRSEIISNDWLWNFYKEMDFSKLGYREYWEKRKQFTPENMIYKTIRLVTSTHCNRKCSFCSVTRMHEFACGRMVSPAYLEKDKLIILLNRIKEQIPEATRIYFCEDSVFTLRKRTDEFIEALQSCPHFDYLVQTETDKVDEDIIRRLAEARTIHISFGVENCSTRIRKLMGKPQDAEKIEKIIYWCLKYGVQPYYLIILFDPNSTIDDLWINVETLTRWIDKGCIVSIEPFMMPYKGALVWYQDFDMGYKFMRLSNGKVLKHPYIIYPKDPQVRQIMERFRELLPSRVEDMKKELGIAQESKNFTGKVMVKLLKDLLYELAGHTDNIKRVS